MRKKQFQSIKQIEILKKHALGSLSSNDPIYLFENELALHGTSVHHPMQHELNVIWNSKYKILRKVSLHFYGVMSSMIVTPKYILTNSFMLQHVSAFQTDVDTELNNV